MAIHDHKQSVQKLETALDNTVTNLQLMHMIMNLSGLAISLTQVTE